MVVYGIVKPLFAAQVTFGCLDRHMPKQKLNLFELASGLVAEPGTGPTKVMWSDSVEATICGRFANDGPDHFRCEAASLNLSGLAYGTEKIPASEIRSITPRIDR